jgi:phage terminase small subunit
MNTGNATQAAKEAYGEIKNPNQVGYAMKQKPQIMQYIMDNASKCAKIQMEIIEDE